MPKSRKYECTYGKYRVFVVSGLPIIEAKKEDSIYSVRQPIFIENINDLEDLFVAISSVINQIHHGESLDNNGKF